MLGEPDSMKSQSAGDLLKTKFLNVIRGSSIRKSQSFNNNSQSSIKHWTSDSKLKHSLSNEQNMKSQSAGDLLKTKFLNVIRGSSIRKSQSFNNNSQSSIKHWTSDSKLKHSLSNEQNYISNEETKRLLKMFANTPCPLLHRRIIAPAVPVVKNDVVDQFAETRMAAGKYSFTFRIV
jgi:galactose-1-phosphate uridylyltransferase